SRARASPRWKATSSSASGCSRPVSTTTRVALVIATVGGAGWAPVAPGTVASALTALLLWLVPFSRAGLVLFFVAVTLIGTWAAEHAERALGGKDPGAIVIDEVAGMTLSVLALPLTLPVLAVAFALFRVFDIVKPFPAGKAQALRGGPGGLGADGPAALARALGPEAPRAVVVAGPGGSAGETVRRVLARLSGTRLVLNERMLAALEASYRRHDRPLPRRAERLALLPQGATPWPGDEGEPAWAVDTPRGAFAVVPRGTPSAALSAQLINFARSLVGARG